VGKETLDSLVGPNFRKLGMRSIEIESRKVIDAEI